MKYLIIVLALLIFGGCRGDYEDELARQNHKYKITLSIFASTYLVDSYTISGNCIILESGVALNRVSGALRPKNFKSFTHCGTFTIKEK